jgi:hypothetical protein
MKRWSWIIAVFALGVFILCGGIYRDAGASPLDDISIPEMRDKVIRAIEGSDKKAPTPKTQEGKEDYKRRIERRMDWLDGRIHQLKLDAARKGRDSKARLDRELPDLLKQRGAAQKKLEELGSTSSAAWHKVKESVDTAVQKLEDAVDRVGSEI